MNFFYCRILNCNQFLSVEYRKNDNFADIVIFICLLYRKISQNIAKYRINNKYRIKYRIGDISHKISHDIANRKVNIAMRYRYRYRAKIDIASFFYRYFGAFCDISQKLAIVACDSPILIIRGLPCLIPIDQVAELLNFVLKATSETSYWQQVLPCFFC